MKILTVIGARPQFVKSAVFSKCCFDTGRDEVVVHTGQHYDADMSLKIFEDLGCPPPKYIFDGLSRSPQLMIGEIMRDLEEVVNSEKPDFINIFGDTTSTLAAALYANKSGISLLHIEAGLRSRNWDMPEEYNRLCTDILSDYLFCPTESAFKNIQSENLKGDAFNVGDVMLDAIRVFDSSFRYDGPYSDSDPIVLTLHRSETLKRRERLAELLDYVFEEAKGRQILFPIHPNTKKHCVKYEIDLSRFEVIDPLSYIKMQGLLKLCHSVYTDSGGMQKEAFFHRKPCITLRNETEWGELIDLGWNRLWKEKYLTKVDDNPYGDGFACNKILDILD